MEYYFKTDFQIVETFTDSTGVPIDLNDLDFELIYQTTGVDNYKAFKKGEVLINCSIDTVDSSKLIVVFQNHKLSCGQLHREIKIKVLNPLFEDYQQIMTHPFTEIYLVQNGGDQTTGYASAGIPVVIPLTPSIITDIADTDSFLGISALGIFLQTTWLNIKSKLKTYFDTLFEPKKAATDLYVTQAEKSTWNAKQDALSADVDYLTPTTASTTYEPKKGENDNYVTDDEKTVIENTSGENTGDETAESIIDKIGTDGQIKSDYLPSLDYSTNIEADKLSTTKVSAIKTLYDWAVGKFIDLGKIVTTWSATPTHDSIPSEKLVKDSLDLKADITPTTGSTSALRALFIARGYYKATNTYYCVYNANTGYYEMNGLTDLTEAQMVDIYINTAVQINIGIGAVTNFTCMSYSNIRTSFPRTTMSGLDSTHDISRFRECNNLEIYKNYQFHGHLSHGCSSMFNGCSELHTVDFINLTIISNVAYVDNCLTGCVKLVTANVKNLKVSFSFKDCPLLSLDSLQYLVTNRANGTSTITITVHPTVWGYLNDAVNYPTWNALLVDAVANQYIDFASA